ncbi:MAG: hypothetical protein ABGX05_13890 [Pirellulaceae bacterium]
MTSQPNRRTFLQWATAGSSAVGLNTDFLGTLPTVSTADAALPAGAVTLSPEIEPLVQLIENTDRGQLLESVGSRIRTGTSYQSVLAALILAGVRNVQPRPAVGFKFHAVLVVNAAHIASLASPAEHRWLPIFWALDYFKSAQADDVKENNWTMTAVNESSVPRPSQCQAAFQKAMDNWDESAADAAAAGIVRHLPAHAVYEMFFRYGARDYRSIGHKAIFVANSWRTLQCIGWRHAEPIVRSLAYALLNHDGANPSQADHEADRPWRDNLSRATRFRQDWLDGKNNASATRELLATLRSGNHAAACDLVMEQINNGVSPQSVWDAFFLDAGELLIRQPAIIAMHSVTSTNALRFAFRTTANDNTRRMILLQTAAFLTLFHQSMRARGKVGTFQIDQLKPFEAKAPDDLSANAIFSDVSDNKMRAAQRVLRYLDEKRSPQELLSQARLLMFHKGRGSHDYKFGSAVLEDYYQVSPAWRNRYLASAVYNLRGSNDPDSRLLKRSRDALG